MFVSPPQSIRGARYWYSIKDLTETNPRCAIAVQKSPVQREREFVSPSTDHGLHRTDEMKIRSIVQRLLLLVLTTFTFSHVIFPPNPKTKRKEPSLSLIPFPFPIMTPLICSMTPRAESYSIITTATVHNYASSLFYDEGMLSVSSLLPRKQQISANLLLSKEDDEDSHNVFSLG